MSELFTPENVAHLTGLQKIGLSGLAHPLMKLVGLEQVNALYKRLANCNGRAFVDAFFQDMCIETFVSEKDRAKLPATGGFIAVANHPFGTIDGLLMLKILLHNRPDTKILANFLLQHIQPIEQFFIAVNPFEEHKQAYSSIAGMKKALQHVHNGGVLGIFPAGEVSSFRPSTGSISDREWQLPAIKLIRKAQVPIIPMYFNGGNSPLFHLLGMVSPSLRTASLAKEMLNKRNTSVHVRIGSPISVKDLSQFETPAEAGAYLRARVYALGSGIKVKKFFKPDISLRKKPKDIAKEISADMLSDEISRLPIEAKIASQGGFSLYLAPAAAIPNVLLEIGRLRECTFRSVGEGSLKSRDLDPYDTYYEHLFLWDEQQRCIVGAYRLGRGADIVRHHGKKGFYTASLFKFKKPFLPILEQSIELGRSFIVPSYQRHRLPLFMLWQGILAFLLQHPEYRYLLGPVSISNDYSELSKESIVSYIQKAHFRHDLAEFIKPKHPFRSSAPENNATTLVKHVESLASLNALISDIEPSGSKLPILLLKYIKQNACILGFNVDPDFNNALDGLMLLDVFDVPKDIIEQLSKEFDDKAVRKHPAFAMLQSA